MHDYLVALGVAYTSLDPVSLRVVDEDAASVIIWVGVEPGSLSHEDGVNVAVALRDILLAYHIEDVHVEIRESVLNASAKMYKPVPSSNPTVQVREHFSTALGIPICAEETPHIQGTATLFFTVASKPGQLFLLTAKHVLFRVDEDNGDYTYNTSVPRRNVLLFGTNGFEARVQDIEAKTGDARITEMRKHEKAITQLEQFLVTVQRDWSDPQNRVIGHVVRSPPLILSDGKDRVAQDFAVIEVDSTKIDANNFVGNNAIDLGTEIAVGTLTAWMHPKGSSGQSAFEFPGDRLLKFVDILSMDKIRSPDTGNRDSSRDDPTIMVLKRGSTTGLTIGRLNNLRSVLRKPYKALGGAYSMEVAVFPRTSQSGAFSDAGDSGAAVVDGKGAVASILTSNSGSSEVSDCAYVTPISFLLECLKNVGYPANIFPTAADAFA
ncbi:hypothetical protein BDW22DRAFT_1426004 [Trametopsis cervina]|nr:hypothetical protein BDW22DRAFT_1426004 [Trametopsis cervina]